MFTKILLLTDLVSFLNDPFPEKISVELNYKEKFQYLLQFGLLAIVIYFVFFIVAVIEKLILYKYGIEIIMKDFGLKGIPAILIIAFLGPFREELLFRLPLSFRKKDINIWIFTLLGMITIYTVSFYKDNNLTNTGAALINCFIIMAGAGIIYLFNRFPEESLEKIKISSGKYIVRSSVIIFTLAHLTNIVNFDIRLLLIYLINLFPIFFLATILSFCRLRLGFFYGFLFHIAWNFLPALNHI